MKEDHNRFLAAMTTAVSTVATAATEPLKYVFAQKSEVPVLTEQQKEMVKISRRISAEVSKRPKYNADQFYDRFMKPLVELREAAMRGKRQRSDLPSP